MQVRVVFLSLFLLIAKLVCADEGLWLPYLLGQQVYDDMVKKGLTLSKEQIYSINKASLKDAVILFGGGCTGEVVSSQGLIFTNHHCVYSSINEISTSEKDYLKNGFFARRKEDEIPVKGLSVQFLIRVEDVTAKIKLAEGLTEPEKAQQVEKQAPQIVAGATNGTGYEGRVLPIFNGKQYLLFIYQRFTDLRLVAAPPESIGEFGAITDTWEWPRHAGDFAVLRIYTSQKGENTPYARENVPMKPRYFMPVSIKGIKENDFAMVMGYPDNTDRYISSFALKLKMEEEDPALVRLLDLRAVNYRDRILNDAASKKKLAAFYGDVNNKRKFVAGELAQLIKSDLLKVTEEEEAVFEKWALGKTEYKHVLKDYAAAYARWWPYAKHRVYLYEGIRGSFLLDFAANMSPLIDLLSNPNTPPAEVKQVMQYADGARKWFIANTDRVIDQKIIAGISYLFYTNIPKEQHPKGLFDSIAHKFGSPGNELTWLKLSESIQTNTLILDDDKWQAFISNPSAATLQSDPAFAYCSAFLKNYERNYAAIEREFFVKDNELKRLYVNGWMTMQPDKKWYPDANMSMRLSYGQVKSYAPRNGVKYNYACTMAGVLEKYKPGDLEFDLSQLFISLYKKKDFGRYKDEGQNDLVTCFITNNDITAGNSGSPVINAYGELVGIVFDGNFEGLDHKLTYNPQLNRTVCVDIRYVLWCIEKLGGATNIINELKIIR